MYIPLTEPLSPRYIYINPDTNKMHLLVPIVGGEEISTDNTCKAITVLRNFFDGGAQNELITYKNSLLFDLKLLGENHPAYPPKKTRLEQIELYIQAISAMQNHYSQAINALLEKASNLYAIQLRPREPDPLSKVINPLFTVERRNDATGTPLSALYNAMYEAYPYIETAQVNLQSFLIQKVLETLPANPNFAHIQEALTTQCLILLGHSIDFTRRSNSEQVTQATIDVYMNFNNNATPQDYIEALLAACAPYLWNDLPIPPFYGVLARQEKAERTERLSILTQFFLAILNVYCKIKGISNKNFGAVLDKDPELSRELVKMICNALIKEKDVEQEICTFLNVNINKFNLLTFLDHNDLIEVKQKFTLTYHTVTAINENPHMDDFMILNSEAQGESCRFVTHQGAICVNFAEIIDSALPNQNYFSSIRADFLGHSAKIPHKNEWISSVADIELEPLLVNMTDDLFTQLPEAIKEACRAHPTFQMRQFLHDVAQGKQFEANALLTQNATNAQNILQTPGVFADYSGRIFNCTAYEYAYWAKDTHMRRMLEQHMDENTKAFLSARIEAIERIDPETGSAMGLVYQQHGNLHRSAHFDFMPLRLALHHFSAGANQWFFSAHGLIALRNAWIAIGKAQRDVPAHVAQEYCRANRSFVPTPQFKESDLPRNLTFYNEKTGQVESWFPLTSSQEGLGYTFAITRGQGNCKGCGFEGGIGCAQDLAALIHLDEIRTGELMESRISLNTMTSSLNMML
ncbi:hypothetical protein [Legionella saoudiensis]|uniref:hypothetical protein n=1 Tax=Legionella saoudiensis TaxID=1750561 RepID=UPI0007306C34|nr:hypothetical protein [Legionella saoudiensis]